MHLGAEFATVPVSRESRVERKRGPAREWLGRNGASRNKKVARPCSWITAIASFTCKESVGDASQEVLDALDTLCLS